MDIRDDVTWVTLELTPLGEERVQDGTLVKTLREELGAPDDFPVFIPATTFYKGNSQVTVILLEGYAFVASGLDDVAYFKLEKRPHVAKVLSLNEGASWRMRTPMTVPNAKIAELRKQLQEQAAIGVSVGDEVRIMHGRFRNLDGLVRDIQGDSASVEIVLRSLEVITSIPRMFLEVLRK